MNHQNIRAFKLTAVAPEDSENAMAAIVTTETGEQQLLSFSHEVAAQIFGQIHAALGQLSKAGKRVEIPSTPERIVACNAVPFRTEDGEMLVDILVEGDQSPRALHGVMQRMLAKSFAALLQSAAESSGTKPAKLQ